MRVYLLNLPRSVDRRDYMLGQLRPMGIDPVIVSGDDRQEMLYPPKDYDGGMAHKHLNRQMGLGEIGCLTAQLRAYQQIINSGDEWGIILEDDAHLFQNPVEAFQRVIDSHPGARLILGVDAKPHNCQCRVISRTLGSGVLELTGLPYGNWCLAIHRKHAAQAIVHLRQSLHMPADVYWQRWVGQNPEQGMYFQIEGVAEERETNSSVIGDEARMSDFPPSAWRMLESTDLCPLLIHQVWLGPNMPTESMLSWRRMNPDRIHKVWEVDECRAICADYGLGAAFELYLQSRYYPGAADMARYCILHRHGGFYADADTNALRPLDLRHAFLVQESETHRPGLLCNGFIQCKAQDPLMLDLIKHISTLNHPVTWDAIHQELGPSLLTRRSPGFPRQYLPSGLFLPEHFMGPNPDNGNPYCDHSWGSTYGTNRYLMDDT